MCLENMKQGCSCEEYLSLVLSPTHILHCSINCKAMQQQMKRMKGALKTKNEGAVGMTEKNESM
jgi:hypothetical protein